MPVVYNPNNLITAPVDFSAFTLTRMTATVQPSEINPTGQAGDVYLLRGTSTTGVKTAVKTVTSPTFLSAYFKECPSPNTASIGLGSANYVYYDTVPFTGGVLAVGASIASHSWTDVGNGWYLLKATLSSAGSRLAITFGTNTGTQATASSTNGILVWGAFAYTADEAYFTIVSSGGGGTDADSLLVLPDNQSIFIPFF